ncbi:MAG: cytochrome c [Fimbriimonas ginsengisoli]|uniref:Cytochrome c n=1 Tax=Fimbriimonas ginsengisoli TaxID=1005039 RepID=A0A931LVV7_FIMGI|nr:cytochrome c [Fimbriimonas ginsengisoli]
MKRLLILAPVAVILGGCHTDMWQQPRLSPLDESGWHGYEGQASRPLPKGTVARGHLQTDDAFFTGRVNGKYVEEFPIQITKDVLLRGQERFNIYCTPCHGRLGDGNGMITKRGLALRRKPASYHTDRLRKMPVGHFYDVITNGYGAMFSYAARVEPQDRWAIAAYIRALQLSQNANAADVDSRDLAKLQSAPKAEKEVAR